MTVSIQFRLTGGAANSTPSASLGGVTSSVQVSGTSLHNLFSQVSEAERAAGSVKYRAIDIVNVGDTASTVNDLSILSQTSSADTDIAIGYDSTAGSHALTDNLETLANEDTAPAGITFSQPTSGAPITTDSVQPGEALRVHLRRTVQPGSTSYPSDACSIRFTNL